MHVGRSFGAWSAFTGRSLILWLPFVSLCFLLVVNILELRNPRWSIADRQWMARLDVSDYALASPSTRQGSQRIAIVSFATNNGGLGDTEIFSYLVENKRRYAKKHGYDFVLLSKLLSPGRHPSWQKIPLALSLLFPSDPSQAYEWVWLLDTDSLLTNNTLSIEEHILGYIDSQTHWALPNVSVVLTKDCNGLNGGSFMLHRTKFAFDFMVQTWSEYSMLNNAVRAFWEQGGMVTAIARHGLEDKMTWVPQSIMNAYPGSGCGYAWKPGDFVCHFPSDSKRILKLLVKERIADNILERTCESGIC